MKIVVLDGGILNPGDLSWAEVEALGSLTVYDKTPHDQAAVRIGDAEAILVSKVPITRQVMEACGNLRYIGVTATGYNVVDIAAATERGITVTNVPAYSSAAVAQFVFAHLLALAHPVDVHARAVRDGEWKNDWCFWKTPMLELEGKTMGLVGYGQIGRAVAKIARALGMEVAATSRSRTSGRAEDGTPFMPLEELLPISDVLSLHCPLFPETKGLICEKTIAKMKDGAILINTARGPLVDEKALDAALNSGKLRGAGLDVMETEPPAADNPLLQNPRCNITPHIAWAPLETRARLMHLVAENLRCYLAGSPVHTVE